MQLMIMITCSNLVGVVGSNGALTGDAALKASHFIQLCAQRRVPIVFLQHTTSSSANEEAEAQGSKSSSTSMF